MDIFRLNTATLAVHADRRARRERNDRRPGRAGDAATGPAPATRRPVSCRGRCSVSSGCSSRSVCRWRSDGTSRGVRSSCRRRTTSAPRTFAPKCWPSPRAARSATLLKEYTDAAIDVADAVPGTGSYREAVAHVERLQGDLWALATDAVSADPVGTGPRLYTETLNNMFDTHTSRVASLGNRVPTPVMILLVLGSAVAVGVLAFYLTLLGKGLATSLITAGVVLIILFVSFDLDRPQRGFIQVPDAALVQLRESFDQP